MTGPEDGEAERHETAQDQEKATDDSGKRRRHRRSDPAKKACRKSPVILRCGRGGIGRNCRNPFEPKNNEDEPEENPDDDVVSIFMG